MKLGNLDIDNVLLGSEQVDRVMLGSETVWENYQGPPSPVRIDMTGHYFAGSDFPANKELTITVVGGGGGGGGSVFSYPGWGGVAAQCKTTTVTLEKGTAILVTVGSGGSGGSNSAGNSGGATSFGDYVKSPGGAGGPKGTYDGNTACRDTNCFSTSCGHMGNGGTGGSSGGSPGNKGGKGLVEITWEDK